MSKSDQGTKVYGLHLADGTRWCFCAGDPELQPWLEKFARVLCLRYGSLRGARRVVFRAAERLSRSERQSLLRLAKTPPDSERGKSCWAWGRRNRFLCAAPGGDDDKEFVYAIAAAIAQQPESGIALMSDALNPVYLHATLKGGLPLHAALAEFCGKGVLFAAPGGTGKSTCASRLPPPWKSHCDDTALIVRDASQCYHAHPFPTWSDHLWGKRDSRWSAEHHLPVSAIFFLQQAPCDSVERLGEGAAALHIQDSAKQILIRWWKQMLPELRKRMIMVAFENACTLARRIPAFKLKLSLMGSFWQNVEETLAALLDNPR